MAPLNGVLLHAALAEGGQPADVVALVGAVAAALVLELDELAADQAAVDVADAAQLERGAADGLARGRDVVGVDVQVRVGDVEEGEGKGQLEEGLHCGGFFVCVNVCTNKKGEWWWWRWCWYY